MKIKGMVSVLLLLLFCFSTVVAADFDSVIDTDQPETVMSVDTLNADGELMSADIAASSANFGSHDLSDADQVLSFAGDADMKPSARPGRSARYERLPRATPDVIRIQTVYERQRNGPLILLV